jgi:predicted AAA+ superfamily ATPase
LEVDFILGDGEVAIEVKGSPRVHRRDLRSLETFAAAYAPRSAIVVSMENRERRDRAVRIVPVSKFLEELWSGQII